MISEISLENLEEYIDQFFNNTENEIEYYIEDLTKSNEICGGEEISSNIYAIKIGGTSEDLTMYAIGDKVKSYFTDFTYKNIKSGSLDNYQKYFQNEIPTNDAIYKSIINDSEYDDVLFKQINLLYNKIQTKITKCYEKIINNNINNEIIAVPSISLSKNDLNEIAIEPSKIVPLVNKLILKISNIYIGSKEDYKRKNNTYELLKLKLDSIPKLQEPKTWDNVKHNHEIYVKYLNNIEHNHIKIISHINKILDNE
jgi:hypothetical protein